MFSSLNLLEWRKPLTTYNPYIQTNGTQAKPKFQGAQTVYLNQNVQYYEIIKVI